MPRRGRAAAGAADGASTQLELFPLLEPLSKGIMEKTMPVLWNGEDLDIPTFKRRNAAVDNGKLVGVVGKEDVLRTLLAGNDDATPLPRA